MTFSHAEVNKRYRERHPHKSHDYYIANRERIRDQQVDSRLRARYGITKAEFDAMVIRQAHCCLVCGRRVPKLHVDHDHRTGEVRGLLCPPCNKQLGYLEKPGWLESMFKYLGLAS